MSGRGRGVERDAPDELCDRGSSGSSLSSLDRDAADYPALYPFGTGLVDFLTAEEEIDAPFEERLRSVWRYIVGRVKRFETTLTTRERAILDSEDMIHSIVAQLIEKDHFWDPARGKYTTFVESIILNVLSTCHEQARSVSGPANSFARLRVYYARRDSGTLTRSMLCTMRAIEHVMMDFTSMADAKTDDSPKDDTVDPAALVGALRKLDDPIQVWILVHKYGLFGTQPLTLRQIAKTLHIRCQSAKILIKEAQIKIKAKLQMDSLHATL